MSDDELEFDEPDNGWDDDEYPDDDDLTLTVPCPECGAEIYEDALRCPACGEYITHGTSAWSGRPVWWILLGVVGVLATIVVLGGLGWW